MIPQTADLAIPDSVLRDVLRRKLSDAQEEAITANAAAAHLYALLQQAEARIRELEEGAVRAAG